MADGASSNVIGVRDVYDIVSRLEAKVDNRMEQVDVKVDHLASRIDRLDGAISVFKWLGPAGVVGIVYGLGKAAGYW